MSQQLAESFIRQGYGTPDANSALIAILVAVAERAPDTWSPTLPPHVNNSPGGSPDPWGPAADAPRRELALSYRPMSDILAERIGAPSGYLSAREALRRIRRAADLHTSGGYWAREDCTDYMLTRIMERAAEHAPSGTARVDWLPERDLSPLSLRSMARDWARREATRAAESVDAAAENTGDAMAAEHVHAEAADGSPSLSPDSARRLAERVCDHLGTGTLGGVFEVLYCAMRDTDTDESAAELGLAPAALRKRVSRGAQWMRKTFPNPADLYRALEPYRDAAGVKPKRHVLGRARAAGWQVRTGTDGGRPAVRPTDAEHARALCQHA